MIVVLQNNTQVTIQIDEIHNLGRKIPFSAYVAIYYFFFELVNSYVQLTYPKPRTFRKGVDYLFLFPKTSKEVFIYKLAQLRIVG